MCELFERRLRRSVKIKIRSKTEWDKNDHEKKIYRCGFGGLRSGPGGFEGNWREICAGSCGASRRAGSDEIREDQNWDGRAWAHLSWRHDAVWHGATQSRHLQRGLGLLLGVSLLRHIADGLQPHALKRDRRSRLAGFSADAGNGSGKDRAGQPGESARRVSVAFFA